MNAYQRALRDFQNYSDDVSRSRYQTIQDAFRRLASTLVPGTPIGDVATLLPSMEFDAWIAKQSAT